MDHCKFVYVMGEHCKAKCINTNEPIVLQEGHRIEESIA